MTRPWPLRLVIEGLDLHRSAHLRRHIVEQPAELGQTFVSGRVKLIDGDDVRRQPGEVGCVLPGQVDRLAAALERCVA
jgi:hypothetical protein